MIHAGDPPLPPPWGHGYGDHPPCFGLGGGGTPPEAISDLRRRVQWENHNFPWKTGGCTRLGGRGYPTPFGIGRVPPPPPTMGPAALGGDPPLPHARGGTPLARQGDIPMRVPRYRPCRRERDIGGAGQGKPVRVHLPGVYCDGKYNRSTAPERETRRAGPCKPLMLPPADSIQQHSRMHKKAAPDAGGRQHAKDRGQDRDGNQVFQVRG